MEGKASPNNKNKDREKVVQNSLLTNTLYGYETLKNDVPIKHLMKWVSSFNGLLWNLEIKKSKLHLLNTWEHPLLGNDTARLLKDVHYRHAMIHPQDNILLAEFWDVVTFGEPASVIFRVLNSEQCTMTRFILKGWAVKQETSHIYGSLQELPEAIASHENGYHPHWILSHTNYPVIEIDFKSKNAFIDNASAHALFGIQHNLDTPHLGTSDISIQKILPDVKSSEHCFNLSSISDNNLNNKSNYWIGTRNFTTVQGNSFQAIVRITAVPIAGRFRIAFIRTLTDEQIQTQEYDLNSLLEAVNNAKDFKEALTLLLDVPFLPNKVDGIIFSNIQSSQERVTVYGVGQCFEKLQWGMNYTYKGTIAQDIERFMLSHLVVDDTHNSIKSIDWVLFNPYGIRSYFAKPFFYRKKLHAVLIFCSKTPKIFTPENGDDIDKKCTPLFPTFEYMIKKWRKSKFR